MLKLTFELLGCTTNLTFAHPGAQKNTGLDTPGRKLEECHDQMVHPQKRGSIKKADGKPLSLRVLAAERSLLPERERKTSWQVLKSTIIRILELKEQAVRRGYFCRFLAGLAAGSTGFGLLL